MRPDTGHSSSFLFRFIICPVAEYTPVIAVIRHSREEDRLLPPSSGSSGCVKTTVLYEKDDEIDEAIVWAFGHALIQHEATLFHKTRWMLSETSLSREEFRAHLEILEAEGHLMECQFQGMRCWRRLADDPFSTGRLPWW